MENLQYLHHWSVRTNYCYKGPNMSYINNTTKFITNTEVWFSSILPNMVGTALILFEVRCIKFHHDTLETVYKTD